ncbi:alkaline phosphatase family protein [Nocardioides sp. GXQ0305]|uniref:phage holin family protein n=1 Tax=Nocardioides sp. GXQ0305 TaxID=3423912 RepID=UPI003D7D77B0
MVNDEPTSGRSRRVTLADLGRLLSGWLVTSLTLVLADAVQPELTASSFWSLVAVAAVSGVVGLVVRPLLIAVSARLGWIAVLPLALVGQAVVMYVAMQIVPGITATFLAAFVTSWICAAVGTLVAYVTTAGTDDGLTSALARRVRPRALEDPEVEGVVMVQLDGVPFPVLRWAVQAGGVPTIRRWVTSGAYRLREWTPQMPCTTPASQLGILHGTVAGVPAFRWYDRELGRVLVANRPDDARIIEDRATDGRGLLYDDGVSISNLFSGDAPRSLLTMSRAGSSRGTPQTRKALAWFLLTPTGFARSLTRTLVEIVKERWQAHQQERHQLDPRVHRGWTFAALRAVTNALLRDVNTALVAEEMFRGTKAVYVDYVDYDEIAHHAGMFRRESLAALEGLDRVLGQLERLTERAPRRYRIVVVSDHGQSQGRPFADRYGSDLSALCSDLMAQDVTSYAESVEGWGRADSLVEDIGSEGLSGRLAASADRRVDRATGDDGGPPTDVVVLGSGNLGLVYVPGERRLVLEEIEARWPRLLPGLCEHPGVGFVAVVDADGVPWALGRDGRCHLTTGAVEGTDPLGDFGDHARRVLTRAVLMPEAPDVYVNSLVDEDTLDIAAFEALVGAHGGLGGWQDSAVLLAPRDLAATVPERVEGADELHRVLVGFLERAGQRRTSPTPVGGE